MRECESIFNALVALMVDSEANRIAVVAAGITPLLLESGSSASVRVLLALSASTACAAAFVEGGGVLPHVLSLLSGVGAPTASPVALACRGILLACLPYASVEERALIVAAVGAPEGTIIGSSAQAR